MTSRPPRGAPEPPGSGATGGDAEQRAEELVGRVGRDVSRFVARAAARVREEAEDIWAEAQHERRSAPGPADGS